MSKSKIEWTEMTWNPTTGCNKISPGCKYCYAEIFADRLQAMGNNKYKSGFKFTLQPDALNIPRKWKDPKIVFVNSMSDLFHEKMSIDYLKKIFDVMNECQHHIFQVLTKRSDILLELSDKLSWTPNIWMGVSVENADYKFRIDDLRKTPAHIKFLSLEPLLGPLPKLNLNKIDWVIVGGESGRKPRPMKEEWVLEIKKQCESKSVAFFFKQWGGMNKKLAGRELNGRTYDEMPEKAKAELELFEFA
jgi:protein gp37